MQKLLYFKFYECFCVLISLCLSVFIVYLHIYLYIYTESTNTYIQQIQNSLITRNNGSRTQWISKHVILTFRAVVSFLAPLGMFYRNKVIINSAKACLVLDIKHLTQPSTIHSQCIHCMQM